MTLIASFLVNNCPVIIGDVLVSIPSGTSDEDISIPSRPSAAQSSEISEGRIVKLTQKINVISDHLCIAWCGSHIRATTFIKDLRLLEYEGRLSYCDFLEFLSTYPAADTNDLSVIMHYVDGSTLKRHHLNVPEFPYDGLNIQVAGSGSDRILEMIQHVDIPAEISAAANISVNDVVGPALTFVTKIFGHQVMTGDGLDEGWGGAFELAIFKDNKFQKVSNILNLYWHAIEGAGHAVEIRHVPFICKLDYVDESLNILIVDGADGTYRSHHYIIEPTAMPAEDPMDSPADLDYEWLINYVHIDTLNGKNLSLSKVERYRNDSKPVRVTNHGEGYFPTVTSVFLEELGKELTIALSTTDLRDSA